LGFACGGVVAAGAVLAALGWFDLARRDVRTAVAIVVPGALSGGLMLGLGHNMWPRFFFFLMGFALLITVHGAAMASRLVVSVLPLGDGKRRAADATAVAVVAAMIVVSAATVPRNYALPKQSFTAAREFVERSRAPEDRVVAVGLAGYDFGQYYAPEWSVATSREQLDALAGDHRVWVVYTLPVELAARVPDVWHVVRSQYEVVKIFSGTLGGGEVYVCMKEGGA
jgi:mannosyltransferase